MKFFLFVLLISLGTIQAQSPSTFSSPDAERIKELQELHSIAKRNAKLKDCSAFKFSPLLTMIEKCRSYSFPKICISFVAFEIQIVTAEGKKSTVRSERDGYIFPYKDCIMHTIENIRMPSSITNFKGALRRSDGSMDLQMTFKGNDISVNVPLTIESQNLNSAGLGTVIYTGTKSFGRRSNDKIVVRLRALANGPMNP
jgi:hypothetical protein